MDVLIGGTLETLDMFERDCLNSYLTQKANAETERVENKIRIVDEKWVENSRQNGHFVIIKFESFTPKNATWAPGCVPT